MRASRALCADLMHQRGDGATASGRQVSNGDFIEHHQLAQAADGSLAVSGERTKARGQAGKFLKRVQGPCSPPAVFGMPP